MRLVILESPYAGDVEANVDYARRCVRDSLSRGEAPIASHLLYTQPGILNDDDASERQWGIDAGLAWRAVAEASVVYTDRGISRGMEYGIAAARAAGLPVEFRTIEASAPAERSEIAHAARDEIVHGASESRSAGFMSLIKTIGEIDGRFSAEISAKEQELARLPEYRQVGNLKQRALDAFVDEWRHVVGFEFTNERGFFRVSDVRLHRDAQITDLINGYSRLSFQIEFLLSKQLKSGRWGKPFRRADDNEFPLILAAAKSKWPSHYRGRRRHAGKGAVPVRCTNCEHSWLENGMPTEAMGRRARAKCKTWLKCPMCEAGSNHVMLCSAPPLTEAPANAD